MILQQRADALKADARAEAERIAEAKREATIVKPPPWAWHGHTPLILGAGKEVLDASGKPIGFEANFRAVGGGAGHSFRGKVESRNGARKLVPDRNRAFARSAAKPSERLRDWTTAPVEHVTLKSGVVVGKVSPVYFEPEVLTVCTPAQARVDAERVNDETFWRA